MSAETKVNDLGNLGVGGSNPPTGSFTLTAFLIYKFINNNSTNTKTGGKNMKKLILIAIIPILIIFLVGCAQKETQQISAPSNDSAKTTVAEPVKTQTATQPVVQKVPVQPSQPTTVELNLSEGNKTVGYLPEFTTISGVVKGNYVNFDLSGIELLGVYGNAISVRVRGTVLGETFTVAKGAPVDVNTKDGRIRMDFRDNNLLYVEKIVE